MRSIQYVATIESPLSSIKDFPCDLHSVTVRWLSVSTWQTHDMQEYGTMVSGNTYELRYVQQSGCLQPPWRIGWQAGNSWPDGKCFTLLWSGLLAEWKCLGISREISLSPKIRHKPRRMTFELTFHLTRLPFYYFVKVCLLTQQHTSPCSDVLTVCSCSSLLLIMIIC